MFKTSKILYNIMQILLITYLIYCLIFMMYHVLIPNIGNINIETTSNKKDPEAKDITITCTKPSSKYYILIYEEEKNRWAMFFNPTYAADRQAITDTFLPENTMKYVLLEGSKKSNTFSFQIKPKYPINYVPRKESSFHAIYLVPYKIYLFPTFYYCKHTVIYVDALK